MSVGGFVHADDSACTTEVAGKSQDQLQRDLDACNAEIAQWTSILNSTKSTSASYQRDITALTAKINAAQASIKAKTIAIGNLSKTITQKQQKIDDLDTQIDKDHETLSVLLRKTDQIDSSTLAEAMLSNQDLSSFFQDVDSYSATERSLNDVFNELRGVKSQTQDEKSALDKQRAAEAEAKAAIEAAKKQVESDQAQKQSLLADSKNKEKTYSSVLADRQAKAAQIRTALFGLRDTAAIQFGTALQYAQAAQAKTGVQPALILAILQQESNLGANVGSCVITNLSSGETRNVNTGKVYAQGIHPTRDLPVLQSLLPTLGRDPLTTKVSCPLSIGYGGGMGPAQFIPSTWKLMQNRIASATGKSTPDPWDPSDAIMAMSIYLKDILGTTGDLVTDERTAACRYYSGKSCYGATGANVGLSYGNQVMAKVAAIQQNIDLLQGV